MKNYRIVALIASLACGYMQSTTQPVNFELWYKGLRKPPKTPQQKSKMMNLPPIYFVAGTLDDFEHKEISPFNLESLYPGKRKTLDLDISQGRRIIFSDKENLSLDDEVDVFTFPPHKTLHLRFRLLDEGEKAPLSIGPIKEKMMLFGPQSGRFGKTKTGYSLKNNVKSGDIDKRRMKVRNILPYVVPGPPPPPKPAPQPEEAPPEKRGFYEIKNSTGKKLFYVLNDTKQPLGTTSPIKKTIDKGTTSTGWFNDSQKATLYLGTEPFNTLKDGQEVPYYEFLKGKDLFLVAELEKGKLALRAYRTCGLTTVGASAAKLKRINRCKNYGTQTWEISQHIGTYRGGTILKKAQPQQS